MNVQNENAPHYSVCISGSSYQHESAVVYMIMEQIDVGLIHTS